MIRQLKKTNEKCLWMANCSIRKKNLRALQPINSFIQSAQNISTADGQCLDLLFKIGKNKRVRKKTRLMIRKQI